VRKKRVISDKIHFYMIIFGIVFLLFIGVAYGYKEEWVNFGVSLASVIMLTMFLGMRIIYLKINSKFDHLEKLISDRNFKIEDTIKNKKEEKDKKKEKGTF